MRLLHLAALQLTPIAGDPDASWERFERRVRAVRQSWPDVSLVILPELYLAALPGFGETEPGYVASVTTTIPGPVTDRVSRLAQDTGLWLIPGSVFERDGDELFNTLVVIDPDGKIQATYRKVFPWQPYESTAAGRHFTTFDLPGVGTIGVAICYDGSFPETFRQLAWMGAEVVLQPTLTTTRDRDQEIICARANAITNQVFVVNVNSGNPLAVGQSLIIDPEGLVRQEAGAGDEILIDTLDLDAVTRVRRHGSLGLNRPWDQIRRTGPTIELPAYGGRFVPPPWAETAEAPTPPAES